MAECRHCLEEIKAGASRCPHCRGYQSAWATNPGSPRSTLLWTVPMLVFVVCFVWFPLRDLSSFRGDPAEIAGSLEITESRMRHSTDAGGHRQVAILGTLRNNGSDTLENPHFAVRFLDAEGDLVDAHSGSELWLILAPGSEQAFTVEGHALGPESAYADYEIEVTGAARARIF